MPDWAAKLLEGFAPARSSEEWHSYLGWKYFSDSVVGLPPGRSDEGMTLARAAEEAAVAD